MGRCRGRDKAFGRQKTRAAKFPLGELVITPNAAAKLNAIEAFAFLVRHESGDWGEVCEEDCAANDKGLRLGFRLFSVCELDGEKDSKVQFYVITE